MNGAIYNEIEPFAAAWLRGLIAAGHIADGVVDDRSIADLDAADVAGPGQRHFFAGIAGWSIALRLAGVPDDADIWTGSCPCQPFSAAGRRRGTADERHLWPEWFRLIRQCRPPVVFGEQVASGAGRAWLGAVRADLESKGYAVGAADLCAASVGAPHVRQRLFFVAHHRSARLEVVGEQQAQRQRASTERSGEAGELADSAGNGRGKGRRREDRGWAGSTDDIAARELANADRDQGGRVSAPKRRPEPGVPDANRNISSGQLVNTSGARGRRNAGALPGAQARGDSEWGAARRVADVAVPAGATRGPWADADWLACTDGRARPVEPGTFPLAHGVPGRVGRCRAYGNAIVPQVAAAFIRAALEAIGDIR